MTPQDFVADMTRLRQRFGDRAFDQSFADLVWREVHDMSAQAFTRAVDVWIGSRPHTKPPLLSEFREARMNETKRKLDQDTREAVRRVGSVKPLADVLRPSFGGVSGVRDALEIARIRQRTERNGKDGA